MDLRRAHGWIQAAVGCHWTRGRYTISTITGDRDGCYVVTLDTERIGTVLTWDEAEYLCERRQEERRQAKRTAL